jgi:hypothetical protein
MSNKIYVKLHGGEQDGWDQEIEVESGTHPELVYVHRASDSTRIADAEVRDPRLYEVLRDSLAVLAYSFKKADPKAGVTGGRQYDYERCEAADRKLSDPAI